MHSSLGIHLEHPPTTRRADRRVVLVLGAIIGGMLLAYCATRVPYVIAETVGVQPKQTVASMRIVKTPGNAEALRTQFGTMSLLEGLPLSLNELFAISQHELTIHVDNEGNRAIALDAALPESIGATLPTFGYQAWVGDTDTLIAPLGVDVRHNPAVLIPKAFLPWYDGEVTLTETKIQRFGLTIDQDSLTIRGLGTPGAPLESPKVPEGSQVILAASITEGMLPLLGVTETLEPIAASTQVTSALTQNGASVIITKDAEGYGYFLSLPAPSLAVEDLATLGKEIANRQNLSKVSWTSDDGERYTELRAEDDLMVEISAEQDYSFVTVRDAMGKLIRLTETPEILMITNRSLGLAEGSTATSRCLPRAHTWAQSSEIPALTNQTTVATLMYDFLTRTQEISVGTNKIRICW